MYTCGAGALGHAAMPSSAWLAVDAPPGTWFCSCWAVFHCASQCARSLSDWLLRTPNERVLAQAQSMLPWIAEQGIVTVLTAAACPCTCFPPPLAYDAAHTPARSTLRLEGKGLTCAGCSASGPPLLQRRPLTGLRRRPPCQLPAAQSASATHLACGDGERHGKAALLVHLLPAEGT